jgi:hypothetical protein
MQADRQFVGRKKPGWSSHLVAQEELTVSAGRGFSTTRTLTIHYVAILCSTVVVVQARGM